MYEDDDAELRGGDAGAQALEFLLAHACETLLFYADRGNYNAADDGQEAAVHAPSRPLRVAGAEVSGRS